VNTWIERSSVAGAAKLICVSNSLGRHMLAQGFPAARIAVVPNGVPAIDGVLPRATPSGEWTIGTVALFRQRKGTEVLIDALAILREQELPARLRCVGGYETAEYERELKQRVAQYSLEPFVDWTGFTREVNAELNRMDLFALPSLFGEGLPMVVLEAMATGVPVVATDVEGVPEAIRDGIDGVIARPKDADDLAQQIARVMRGELDWQRLRSSALERQRAMFSDESMAAGVAKVYDELI
jgi:glycosyltransferase involved in cell wall biosynthesis